MCNTAGRLLSTVKDLLFSLYYIACNFPYVSPLRLTFSKLEVCPEREFFGKLKKLSLQLSSALLTRVPHTSPVKPASTGTKTNTHFGAIRMQRRDKRIIQPE